MNAKNGRLDFWSNKETARVLDSIAKLLELPSRSSLGNVLLTTNSIDLADIRNKKKKRLALVAQNEQEQNEEKEITVFEVASRARAWKEQFRDIARREANSAPYLSTALNKLNEVDRALKIYSETPRKKNTTQIKAISSKAFAEYALLVCEYEAAITKPNDRTKIKFIGDFSAFEIFKMSASESVPVKERLISLLRNLVIEKHIFEDNQQVLKSINDLQQACNFSIKQYHSAKKNNASVNTSLSDMAEKISALHEYVKTKITN